MEVTDAWKEAGIIGTFSQGNSGPKCETAGSPGDYAGVIGVGATDDQDSLADFSSRGPGDNSTGFFFFSFLFFFSKKKTQQKHINL